VRQASSKQLTPLNSFYTANISMVIRCWFGTTLQGHPPKATAAWEGFWSVWFPHPLPLASVSGIIIQQRCSQRLTRTILVTDIRKG
jgi:hypothetical protein